MNKLLQVSCPQCSKVFFYYQSEFRPFCTERCKMIDLGHWFEESYRVPSKEQARNNLNKENPIDESQSVDQDQDQKENNSEDNFDDDYEDDENNY